MWACSRSVSVDGDPSGDVVRGMVSPSEEPMA